MFHVRCEEGWRSDETDGGTHHRGLRSSRPLPIAVANLQPTSRCRCHRHLQVQRFLKLRPFLIAHQHLHSVAHPQHHRFSLALERCTASKMIPDGETSDDSLDHSLAGPRRGVAPMLTSVTIKNRVPSFLLSLLILAILLSSLVQLLSVMICAEQQDRLIIKVNLTKVAASSRDETVSGAARKYTANHAPVMSPPVQSQLHQNVLQVLRTAQYKQFAAMLDNMTESVVRQGITIFAPSDGALSIFQMNKTEGLRVEEVVRFHVITGIMTFSNLLRLEVGSRLTTEVSNVTIPVTNASAGAYEVDDAVIVDPDLYTDATIAVHGINAVFNTSKIIGEEGDDEPVTGGRRVPFHLHSRALKTSPLEVKGVPLFHVLMFACLFLNYLIAFGV